MTVQKMYICHLSGGLASWQAAKRTAERVGRQNVILLFADTKAEEKSTYAFLEQCVADIGRVWGWHVLCDGRTPWEVFKDERFLGNSRVDPCSRILKRELIGRWVSERFTPESCVQVFGFDWTEPHRFERLQKRFYPWPVEAPLLEPPFLEKYDMVRLAHEGGLIVPLMYRLGFQHNNCSGKCVKAGQAHFAKLLQIRPEFYADAEREEEKLRQRLGNVSILTDRRGGSKKPMSLAQFRQRIAAGDYDRYDYGSCSCFLEAE